MHNIISKSIRPLLAAGLLLGLGMGSASANAYITATSIPSLVRPVPPRPQPVVVTYATTAVTECYECPPVTRVVYQRPRRAARRSQPTVVYYSAPVVVEETVVYEAPRVVYESPRVVYETPRTVYAPRLEAARPVTSTCSSCR